MEAKECREHLSKMFSGLSEFSIGGLQVHRNPNGMSRRISFFMIRNGRIENISYYVSRICWKRWHERTNSVIVSGCGFDAFSSVIEELEHEMGIKINHYKI